MGRSFEGLFSFEVISKKVQGVNVGVVRARGCTGRSICLDLKNLEHQ